jgi:predicted P-loop ATPase
MDSLPFSKSATRLEEMIRDYLNGHELKDSLKTSIENQSQEIERKIQNLLEAVERGIGSETVLSRIKALENEKKLLEQEKSRNKNVERDLDPKEASSQAATFFVNFRKRFDKAPIEEKKALLRQVVLGVSINPVKKIAQCSIIKIPMVSPTFRSALIPSGFVGKTCSGGRT